MILLFVGQLPQFGHIDGPPLCAPWRAADDLQIACINETLDDASGLFFADSDLVSDGSDGRVQAAAFVVGPVGHREQA
ncbi:MAG: hypothetical protein N2690_02330 [Rhodocyclaceae bacterium]|nr:hypothetical protein [Rhodocyclaceae bacterium]